MEKWRGKIAVVTGAASGMGGQIARDFANAGINVIALDIQFERLESLRKEMATAPGKVTAILCDVTKYQSVASAFAEIEKTFGVVHIMVNSAGIMR